MKLRELLLNALVENECSVLIERLPALSGESETHTYGQIFRAIRVLEENLAERARESGQALRVGIVMENGPEWIVADLALLFAGIVEVPVPLAFSVTQADSLLEEIDLCLVDRAGAERIASWYGSQAPFEIERVDLQTLNRPYPSEPSRRHHAQDDAICKIIHTSGTTSRPKGVMIREAGLDVMLNSLLARAEPRSHARYLSLVPLSLLIEQIAAIYLVLAQGGTLVLLPTSVPLLGTEGATARKTLPYVRMARPSALTLTPSLVEAIAHVYGQDMSDTEVHMEIFGTSRVPFLACGGAPTAPDTLKKLAAHSVLIYEGYGLSENSSVVAWNFPGACKLGTVGKALDHVRIRIASDGELLVGGGSLFAGYTRTDPSSCVLDEEGWLRTGDLASIDDEGFIRILGRKKNVIITGNGRNVSPEWVESTYKTLDFVEEAVVLGDGLEELHGVFVISDCHDPQEATERIHRFGKQKFSEIERVKNITVLSSSSQIYERYFTMTGRPLREQLLDLIKISARSTS